MGAKNEFYPKGKSSLIAVGYEYFDGDEDISCDYHQCRRHSRVFIRGGFPHHALNASCVRLMPLA